MNKWCVIFSGLLILITATHQSAQEPTYKQGTSIFIETGVDLPDSTPTWYAPMLKQPHAPVFEILATRGTRGRYYDYTYAVGLKEIIKFHGHDCEGLTHAACCCKVALDVLFPDGIVDRSVLWGISGPSPCWSDVTAFITGARIQYGNLGFFKEARYGHAILLYRQDTKKAVLATWKKGINNIPDEPVVLEESIKWKTKVNMRDVMKLKKAVKRGGHPSPYQVDLMRHLQWKHINDVLSHPLKESYQAKVIDKFDWKSWIDTKKQVAFPQKRSDVKLKNHPYRTAPISMPPRRSDTTKGLRLNKTDAGDGK